MKSIFFLVFLITIGLVTIIFFGCNKSMVQPKTLVANAGPDSVINMTQPGTAWEFEAILNGKGSHSTNSEIVFYSWTAIDHYGSTILSSPNTDSTAVIFEDPDASTGIYQFRLEVRDNLNNFDYDTVSITIHRKFKYEYDGIPWGSTFNSFTYIDLNSNSQLSTEGNWPSAYAIRLPDLISLCTFNGNCNDISSWKIIPFVPRDSIELTDKNIFYSTDSSACCVGDSYTIYATPNAGIDFSQKISVGVNRW
jgi:hypothetical protein